MMSYEIFDYFIAYSQFTIHKKRKRFNLNLKNDEKENKMVIFYITK